MTATEPVPALTVFEGRAAACQSQSGVTESLHYFGALELQSSP